MYYYELRDNRGRKAGVIATIIYFIIVALLLIFLKYSVTDSLEQGGGGGMLISFGDEQSVAGGNAVSQTQAPTQPVAQLNSDEGMMTQDFEDAPVVAPAPERVTVAPIRNNTTQTPTPTTPQEVVREANPNALFPGQTTTNSSSSSAGSDATAGNQGTGQGMNVQGGGEAGISGEGSGGEGAGTGGVGVGFDLSGRSVRGSLPKPQYNSEKSGRVVIRIMVNAKGEVVGASYLAQGSSTSDTFLMEEALKAARKARFNQVDGEGTQVGTITYNFILR